MLWSDIAENRQMERQASWHYYTAHSHRCHLTLAVRRLPLNATAVVFCVFHITKYRVFRHIHSTHTRWLKTYLMDETNTHTQHSESPYLHLILRVRRVKTLCESIWRYFFAFRPFRSCFWQLTFICLLLLLLFIWVFVVICCHCFEFVCLLSMLLLLLLWRCRRQCLFLVRFYFIALIVHACTCRGLLVLVYFCYFRFILQ